MANANMVSCGVGVLSALVVASTASPLAAQEYCVSCAVPKALYRCVLENAVPTGIPLKSICTETLKRQGGHAKCAVRPGTIFDCDAPIRRIDVKSASGVLAKPPAPHARPHDTPAAGPAKAVPPPPASPAAPARPGPPVRPAGPPAAQPAKESDARPAPPPAKPDGTASPLENLTRGLSRATRDTGEAIQDSTRKTLDCISSLFKSC